MPEHIHFLTGKLAEPLLRRVLHDLEAPGGYSFSVQVLPISVAALLTTPWILARLDIPAPTTRIILPGYTSGALKVLSDALPRIGIELGPKDVRDLPTFLKSGTRSPPATYGQFDIQILAEINHASRLSLAELLTNAQKLTRDGADVIDLGCTPGEYWSGVGDAVKMLTTEGIRVSIDSFNPDEVSRAAKNGAELVLSVNTGNRHAAPDWGIEVVAVPDDPATGQGLAGTVEWLLDNHVQHRIDPILEPIGFSFAASLLRYHAARKRWPDAELMMGIGNITELTDVDSAGINTLLLAICQEWGVRSILTTQVIPWAQTCVRECDVARRLSHFAVNERALPKRLDSRLVMLRDTNLHAFGLDALDAMASNIRDHNVRLFAEQNMLHALAEGQRWSAADAFELFHLLVSGCKHSISPSHAFYLGYELAKATTALTLGKQYQQDESLDWGMLTKSEVSHLKRRAPVEEEE